MALQKVGEANVDVVSTSDNYSESVTVEEGDTVYVDTHADAGASGSVSPAASFSGNRTFSLSGETRTVVKIPIDNNTWNYDITATVSGTSNAETQLLINGNVVDSNSGDGTMTANGSVTGTFHFEAEEWYAVNADFDIDVTFSLDQTVSATIDWTSVTTDDIHK